MIYLKQQIDRSLVQGSKLTLANSQNVSEKNIPSKINVCELESFMSPKHLERIC